MVLRFIVRDENGIIKMKGARWQLGNNVIAKLFLDFFVHINRHARRLLNGKYLILFDNQLSERDFVKEGICILERARVENGTLGSIVIIVINVEFRLGLLR